MFLVLAFYSDYTRKIQVPQRETAVFVMKATYTKRGKMTHSCSFKPLEGCGLLLAILSTIGPPMHSWSAAFWVYGTRGHEIPLVSSATVHLSLPRLQTKPTNSPRLLCVQGDNAFIKMTTCVIFSVISISVWIVGEWGSAQMDLMLESHTEEGWAQSSHHSCDV